MNSPRSTLGKALAFGLLLLATSIEAQNNGWSGNSWGDNGWGSGGAAQDRNNNTGATTEDGQQQQLDCTFRKQPTSLIANTLSVQHIVNQAKGTLTVELIYEGEGWVAFGTSPDGTMPLGQVVIAKTDEAVSATNPGKYDMKGRSESAIILSDKQTLIDASYEQANGQTILRFTKLLSESGETEIVADAANTFIFAAGDSNTFGYHGASRGAVTLSLNQFCVSPGEAAGDDGAGGAGQDDAQDAVVDLGKTPSKSLWIAHGILMAISWAILLPIGIGFSLLRKLVPGAGVWFKLHAAVNTLAFLLMTAGFGIAVYQTESGSHFVEKKHRTIGLVIYVLSFVQVLGGIFRPHLPQSPPKQAAGESDEGNPVVTKDLEASNPGDHTESTATAHDASTPPLPPKSKARVTFEIGHRLFGFGLLGLSWYNLYLGILALVALYGQAYNKTTALWGVIGGLSGFILILYVGQTLYGCKKKA